MLPGRIEVAPDRDVRSEEIVPGVVPRPGETFLDWRVEIRGARLLGLGAGREEMLGRGGGADRCVLAPELDLPPLLLGFDAGGDDFLRLLLASDVGAANTTTPIIIRSVNV
ncbi:hypothetical protein ACFL5Z_10690 [Planctomycetota bacterium]